MKKREVDHVLRAAGRITGEKQFIIIGSQSLHGKYPDLPDSLVKSFEVDLMASRNADRTEWLNDGIAAGSRSRLLRHHLQRGPPQQVFHGRMREFAPFDAHVLVALAGHVGFDRGRPWPTRCHDAYLDERVNSQVEAGIQQGAAQAEILQAAVDAREGLYRHVHRDVHAKSFTPAVIDFV